VKRYGQVCSVARALDVVGDRWSLLVVRDLMTGPRRYTDLQDGLPGIGTNVLATRLKELADAGVVTKRELPPPAATMVYELTEAGRALAPVLGALRQWGVEHAPPPQPGDAIRPAWILTSAGGAPMAPVPDGATCELRVGDDVFRLVGRGDGFTVQAGAAPDADVTVAIELSDFLALASGVRTRSRRGWRVIAGDEAVSRIFCDAIAGVVGGSAAVAGSSGSPSSKRAASPPTSSHGSRRSSASRD
jgi:DNA-binding HxlR family transcriptional regulator